MKKENKKVDENVLNNEKNAKDDNKKKINWKQAIVTASIATAISCAIAIPVALLVSAVSFPKYKVTFKNDDGSILEEKDVRLGIIPEYTKATPIKPNSTKEQYYDYDFSGWDRQITTAVVDATYIAQYTKTHQVYKVTYKNYDGNVLEEKNVNKGQEATYTGITPTKPNDESKQYRFKAWIKESGSQEEGAVVYKASYSDAMLGLTIDTEGDTAIVTGYNGSTSEVTIPEEYGGKTVTKINDEAFKDIETLTKVTMPNTIAEIGNYAFSGCTNLSSINLPKNENYKIVSRYLFNKCKLLKKIDIPDNVENINAGAFNESGLEEISIGKGLVDFDKDAFAGCANLQKATISNDNNKFEIVDNKLIIAKMAEPKVLIRCLPAASGNVSIPNDVGIIGTYAFKDCTGVNEVTLNKVFRIDTGAFNGSSITGFDTGNITELGSELFTGCEKLESITIGKGITYDSLIASNPFAGCTHLKSFGVASGHETLSVENDVLYDLNKKKLVRFPCAKAINNFSFPATLEILDNYCFQGCNLISEEFTTPSTITTLNDCVFDSCTNITKLVLTNNVIHIGKSVLNNTKITNVKIGTGLTYSGIDMASLVGCTSLTSIDVDENNESLMSVDGILCAKKNSNPIAILRCPHAKSFGNDGYYEIPDTVVAIYSYAFKDVKSLKKIYIKDSSTDFVIMDDAFKDSGITTLKINTGSWINSDKVTTSSFSGCDYLTNLEIMTLDTSYTTEIIKTLSSKLSYRSFNITSLSTTATINIGIFSNRDCIKSVVLNDEVTTIGDGAFQLCINLESISFTKAVTSIGNNAFINCAKLQSLPSNMENVETIGSTAFKSCTALNSADFSKCSKLTTIGDEAFFKCGNNLKTVVLPDSVTSIGARIFADNQQINSVNLGAGLQTIGVFAFTNNSMLTEISLPATLKTLGNSAFYNSGLKKVTFGGTKDEFDALYNKKTIDVFKYTSIYEITCSDGLYELKHQ